MERIKKFLDVLFVIGVVAFALLGLLIVIIQVVALITLNGKLATNAMGQLLKPATVISVITGLIAFAQSYLYKWKMSD